MSQPRAESEHNVDDKLLDILACPICKGPVQYRRSPGDLVCKVDRLAFPIRDGIPVMLADEATELPSGWEGDDRPRGIPGNRP